MNKNINPKSLSILTPVGPTYLQFLPEYLKNITVFTNSAAKLDWTIEAIIVLDGIKYSFNNNWPANCKKINLPTTTGTATARTSALTFASSKWIYPLDVDDLIYTPGALQLLENLNSTQYAWLSTNRINWDDQYVSQWQPDYLAWKKGDIFPLWFSPAIPMHPNSVCVLRTAALAVGGWPAVPVLEDIAFIFALTDNYAGLSTPHTVTRYREWTGQKIKRQDRVKNKRITFKIIDNITRMRRLQLGLSNPSPLIIPTDLRSTSARSSTMSWPEKFAAYQNKQF